MFRIRPSTFNYVSKIQMERERGGLRICSYHSQTKRNFKAQAQRARIDIAVEPSVKAMKEAFFNHGLEFIILLWKKSTAMRSTRAMYMSIPEEKDPNKPSMIKALGLLSS
jgi:hypothetical protein